MQAEGKPVSIAQLCRWFVVPRSTLYYRPATAQPAVIDPELSEQVRTIIDA